MNHSQKKKYHQIYKKEEKPVIEPANLGVDGEPSSFEIILILAIITHRYKTNNIKL